MRIACIPVDFDQYAPRLDKRGNAVDVPVRFCILRIAGYPDNLVCAQSPAKLSFNFLSTPGRIAVLVQETGFGRNNGPFAVDGDATAFGTGF